MKLVRISRHALAFILLTVCAQLAAYPRSPKNHAVNNTGSSSGVATPSGAAAPPQFYIPFTVNENNDISWGLIFGIHPSATNGIDTALGEQEYPPFCVPGCPMAMLLSPGGNAVLDLRPDISPAQIDTYKVKFQPSDDWGYPFIFSWPNLNSYFSGPVRLRSDVTGSVFDIDMKTQTSYTLTNILVGTVYIVAQGPMSPVSLPTVSTIGLANFGLTSIVNPNGDATSAWFEYGTTTAYGTTTSTQSVTGSHGKEVNESISLGSLPANTRFHVRGVAQNIHGTFYGPDKIFSNGTPPAAVLDTTKYRTAIYRDWADARDQKGKRKSVKCKPDKSDFKFHIQAPDTSLSLSLSFSMLTSGTIHRDTTTFPQVFAWDSLKSITYTPASPIDSGKAFIVEGRGFKGKFLKVKYVWDASPKKLKGAVPDSAFDHDILALPMPNLHNVGEDIVGGMTVGATADPNGSHTVFLPKYKDVLKSLVKEHKGGDIYHDSLPHCLNTFDKNGQQISKPQKGLPPDKHNNILFADQLVLKLNVAASDSGDFPPGFGNLIYDNAGDLTPFNGLTIRAIMAYVDSFLGCASTPFGISDSTVYLRIVTNLDTAFSGPLDTVSWSCLNVVCTGVRPISEVPYLHPNPSAAPLTRIPPRHRAGSHAPSVYTLFQNYPNPFNPTTLIKFELDQAAIVTLKVYNILGQQVASLFDREPMDEGEQEIVFDANNLPSGVYFYQLVAKGIGDPEAGVAGQAFIAVKKMMLVR